MAAIDLLTRDDLEKLRDEVAELRLTIERLGGSNSPTLVSLPEAARRLGVTLRAVQRWAKDGRLEVVPVGGARLVRLPAGLPGR